VAVENPVAWIARGQDPKARHDGEVRTDPRQLDGERCDLLVVGGGIQGVAIARDAALRGLAVVLVEARDIAAGTSSRSSRLVHGGLRYLRQGRFGLVREALHERERLLRSVPHLVRPLPMLLPLYRDSGVPAWQLRLGVGLYGRLAGRSTLPPPRRIDAAAAAAAFPGLRTAGWRKALEYYDAATDDTRLTMANALGAVAAGARLATHCALVGVRGDAYVLHDRVADAEVLVRATQLVNAAGPRVDAVRAGLGLGGEPLVRLSRGSHVWLPPRAGEVALAAFLPDGRIQFVIPHPGGTLCGTTEVADVLAGDETGAPTADLDYLLQALGHLLEPAPSRGDLRFAMAGWRALPNAAGPAGRLGREAYTVAERCAGGAVHTVVGGKLTTHRSFAERIVAALFGLTRLSPTRDVPLPGAGGTAEPLDPLWWRHGSRLALVRQVLAEQPDAAAPLCPHRPFAVAEAIAALRHDGPVTLADLLVRRLSFELGPCLAPDCLAAAHRLFVRERRWAGDDEPVAAVAAVRAEVVARCGDLAGGASAPVAG
jgi:glycerol-3-phosphate dehydrogenase